MCIKSRYKVRIIAGVISFLDDDASDTATDDDDDRVDVVFPIDAVVCVPIFVRFFKTERTATTSSSCS